MTRRAVFMLLALVLVPAAEARQPIAKGTWTRLPPAPAAAALGSAASVWTGKQLIVFGRIGTPGAMRNAAFSYTPATGSWRTLSPPKGDPGSYEGSTSAVWTGRLMLVWGPLTALSYDPATNRWRKLPTTHFLPGAPSPLLVWTGKEMITWGGGCCGDVSADGAAYDPATGEWRKLAKAPIAGQQGPRGVWTGKELIVLPGRHADHDERTGGAAYDPKTDSWRKIASPPQERMGSNVVWDGKEVLVVGGWGPPDSQGISKLVAAPYAYDPATHRWRRISAMDNGAFGRGDAAAVWTGKQVLVWGGSPLIDGTIDGVGAPDAWPFMDGATYTPSA